MNKIKKLILEDVRCFQGRQELDIRPLTLLVGENSTGKSTALGCLQVSGNFIIGEERSDINFDPKPYQMGAFADIVRRSNTIGKDCFKLGIKFHTEHGKPYTCLLSLRESKTGSAPVINEIQYIFDHGKVRVIEGEKNEKPPHIAVINNSESGFTIVCNNYPVYRFHLDFGTFLDRLSFLVGNNKEKTKIKGEKFLLFIQKKLGAENQTEIFRSFYSNTYDIRSFGPIRSEPQRTYNPSKETVDPGGSEAPMLLRNLKNRDKDGWEKLHKQLVKYGKKFGLFSDIIVRELGPAISDPFQLQIKVKSKSPAVNLVDVGYGVGQILPILVSIFTARPTTMFLLQQPEVHLHPRGQAELSSLLVSMNKNSNHSFLVETHSDYIIDRTRILVRNGKIKPEDVSILYFESTKTGGAVKVHNMKVDADGNLINVPKNYRDFFIKETDTLLGFDEE